METLYVFQINTSAQSVHTVIGSETKMQFFDVSRDLFLLHFTDCRVLIPVNCQLRHVT
jgi:hypothetical protein